jgi:hypothetical protein
MLDFYQVSQSALNEIASNLIYLQLLFTVKRLEVCFSQLLQDVS